MDAELYIVKCKHIQSLSFVHFAYLDYSQGRLSLYRCAKDNLGGGGDFITV